MGSAARVKARNIRREECKTDREADRPGLRPDHVTAPAVLFGDVELVVEGKSVMFEEYARQKGFRRRNYMPATSIRCSANPARLPPSGLERLSQNEPSRRLGKRDRVRRCQETAGPTTI
jgi:hypothetical protein